MKVYSLKSISLIIPTLSVLLVSCLKDKNYDNGVIQSNRPNGNESVVIEIALTATNTTNFLSTSFDAVDKDTVINVIPVVLASPGLATQDLQVTLTPDPTLVDDYNTNNGTAYVVPDPSMYAVVNPGNVVTIAKGSRVGYLQVKLNPNNFAGGDWAFAYEITNVDKAGYTISGNLNHGIFAFGIKNKYDGHYQLDGTMSDAANASLTGDYPTEVNLETYGSTAVLFNPAQGPFAGAYLHPILASGSPSAYGSFTPIFTFDANDNIISVENAYGQPAGNGRSAELDPSGVNKWFSSDRHIEVKYWMNQPSVISPHRTSFDERYTYIGPR